MDDNLWDWVVTESEKGLQEFKRQGELPTGAASAWTINTLVTARMVQAVDDFRRSAADQTTRLLLIALLLFVLGVFQAALILVSVVTVYVLNHGAVAATVGAG